MKILIMGNAFPVHTALIRRSCLDPHNLFDENLAAFEDWDFWLRLSCRCSFAYLDGLVAEYRVTGENISRDTERMTTAYARVREKIPKMEIFPSLPSSLRAEAYYQWAMLALFQGLTRDAQTRFIRALKEDSTNVRIYLGLYLTYLFGRKAATFYKIKQAILGVRGQQSSRVNWSPFR